MIYVVEKGNTLEQISAEKDVPMWKIIYDNQLDLPDRLGPGQALLLLKEGEKGYEGEGLRIGGYTYPFIEPEILTQAFPAQESPFQHTGQPFPACGKACSATRKSLFRTTDSCRRHVRVAETDAEKAFPRAAEAFSTQRRFYFTDLFCRVFLP